MIEVKDLNVTFANAGRAVHAVRGVSFGVADGESFGIVGESGSGKSTVLKAIAGLIPWTATTLAVAGQPAQRRRSKAERKLMQVVGGSRRADQGRQPDARCRNGERNEAVKAHPRDRFS